VQQPVKVPRRNQQHEKTLRAAPKTSARVHREWSMRKKQIKKEEELIFQEVCSGIRRRLNIQSPAASPQQQHQHQSRAEPTPIQLTRPPREEHRGGGAKTGDTMPTIEESVVHDAQSVHPPRTAEDTKTKATSRRGITTHRNRIIITTEIIEEETTIETNRQEIDGAETQEIIEAGAK